MKTIGSFRTKMRHSDELVEIVYDKEDNTFSITYGDPFDYGGDHIWLSCDDITNLMMQLNKLSIVNQAEGKSNG